MNLQALVRTPAWAVGAQSTQLFILHIGMVDEWMPEETWGSKLWEPDVALVSGFSPTTSTRNNGTETTTADVAHAPNFTFT